MKPLLRSQSSLWYYRSILQHDRSYNSLLLIGLGCSKHKKELKMSGQFLHLIYIDTKVYGEIAKKGRYRIILIKIFDVKMLNNILVNEHIILKKLRIMNR